MFIPIQFKRRKIPYFAKWAKMSASFQKEKHYLSENKICFDVVQGEEYANHIETAGFHASAIISYGADRDGYLRMMRHVVFPTLRLHPNLTESSLDHNFKGVSLLINNTAVKEKAERFVFDGILHLYSRAGDIQIHRSVCAAGNCRACVERVELTNLSEKAITVELCDKDGEIHTKPCFGVNRTSYRLFTQCSGQAASAIAPKERVVLYAAYCGCAQAENFRVDFEKEFSARKDFIRQMSAITVIQTPDEKLNTMAFYAKIRACESIFKTKSGLMHSPGGGHFYAALWTNDECEYINPLFAYLGYAPAADQALNSYAMYQKYITADQPLITSIIAEGDGIWHGAKDRGDSAMYAYGCSRTLLAAGDRKVAEKYLESIRECVDYTISQIGKDGVVRSDSDELENRFESGSYNLCTSCLAYGALISSAYLEKECDNPQRAERLLSVARKLRESIERYFGAEVEGFHTYRYCAEEKRLRAWISIPLVMGIGNRCDETVKALLSEKLYRNGGIVTRSGGRVYWDRSTLYALRGMFYSGKQEQAIELLRTYSSARLLGEHIPYAVEAFPEGNQAQLSAESGLYIRIFTEGILGYQPTGFHSFSINPNLPSDWNEMSVRNIMLCQKNVDIHVARADGQYKISIQAGETIQTQVSDGPVVFHI